MGDVIVRLPKGAIRVGHPEVPLHCAESFARGAAERPAQDITQDRIKELVEEQGGLAGALGLLVVHVHIEPELFDECADSVRVTIRLSEESLVTSLEVPVVLEHAITRKSRCQRMNLVWTVSFAMSMSASLRETEGLSIVVDISASEAEFVFATVWIECGCGDFVNRSLENAFVASASS
jgi:hypothetical protein